MRFAEDAKQQDEQQDRRPSAGGSSRGAETAGRPVPKIEQVDEQGVPVVEQPVIEHHCGQTTTGDGIWS